MPAELEPVVRVRDLVRGYRLSGLIVPAVRGVDLDIHAGTFTAIVGPSGSGKSSLLRVIAAVDSPDSGTVQIAGKDVTGLPVNQRARLRQRMVGFVHQSPATNLLEYLTVRGHLRLAAQMRDVPVHDASISVLLDRLGMADRIDHLPRRLSGGEQQRAAIAFAAVGSPPLLVADEPTGQLDRDHVQEVVDALRELAQQAMAVVVATHDRNVWQQADRVLVMRDGKLEAPAGAAKED